MGSPTRLRRICSSLSPWNSELRWWKKGVMTMNQWKTCCNPWWVSNLKSLARASKYCLHPTRCSQVLSKVSAKKSWWTFLWNWKRSCLQRWRHLRRKRLGMLRAGASSLFLRSTGWVGRSSTQNHISLPWTRVLIQLIAYQEPSQQRLPYAFRSPASVILWWLSITNHDRPDYFLTGTIIESMITIMVSILFI